MYGVRPYLCLRDLYVIIYCNDTHRQSIIVGMFDAVKVLLSPMLRCVLLRNVSEVA